MQNDLISAAMERNLRPGAEFIENSLRRARAVPPAKRQPEVTAVLEAELLQREAAELLPLDSHGDPSLPDEPATQRQFLLAMLKLARANYLCPARPVCAVPLHLHFNAYMGRSLLQTSDGQPSLQADESSGDASGASPELMPDLARILGAYIGTRYYASAFCWDDFQLVADLVSFLDDGANRRAVRSQLDCLARQMGIGQAPLTLRQLRYLLCGQVVRLATDLETCCRREVAGTVELTAWQRMWLPEAAAIALQQMKALDPDNPRTPDLCEPPTLLGKLDEPAVLLCLRVAELGRMQGSDWYVAVGGWRALLAASFAADGDEAPAAVRCSILPHCVSAYDEAKASGGRVEAA
jgi:hypothetical protein